MTAEVHSAMTIDISPTVVLEEPLILEESRATAENVMQTRNPFRA
jgi:hypothetical protein